MKLTKACEVVAGRSPESERAPDWSHCTVPLPSVLTIIVHSLIHTHRSPRGRGGLPGHVTLRTCTRDTLLAAYTPRTRLAHGRLYPVGTCRRHATSQRARRTLELDCLWKSSDLSVKGTTPRPRPGPKRPLTPSGTRRVRPQRYSTPPQATDTLLLSHK